MHRRILSWLIPFALWGVVSLSAQTAAGGAPTVKGGMELVLVAKKTGTVKMTLDGVVTDLVQDSRVPQKAKINTFNDSSVVLVFSNGATTQLGADTELVIEEYLQDPFADSIRVADMTDEPSASRTRLALNRGELIGNVKKLKYDKGSSFIVQTPVGAAGIRGTTFRIVFRPAGTGQAFFTLSTAIGNLSFEQVAAGGTPAPGGPTPAPTTTGTGTAAVPVPQGQEIALTLSVTTNAQGQMVVVVVPPAVQTAAISSATMQQVTAVAAEIAVAVQQAVFTPAPPPAPTGTPTSTPTPTEPGGGGTSGTTGTTGSTSGTTGSTGGTTGTTGTTGTSGTTGTTPSGTPGTPVTSPGGTTTTTTVSGQNFTATVTTTTPPPATPPRIIPTNPGP